MACKNRAVLLANLGAAQAEQANLIRYSTKYVAIATNTTATTNA